MQIVQELPYHMLNHRCNPEELSFESTAELQPLKGIIGQERAMQAVEFGLEMDIRGYNIYMSGMTGTGKTSYAQQRLADIAASKPVPDDWCYIYNFDKPNEPIAINLPAGMGKAFQKDMEEFVKLVKIEIPKAFDSEDYEKEKSEIVSEYENRRNDLVAQLSEDAEKHGFKVKSTGSGLYFQPVIEGKILSEEEYSDLDERIKNEIDRKSNEIQRETLDIIRTIKAIERETEEKVVEWETKIALLAVGVPMDDLREKYCTYEKINAFLAKVQEDILQHLEDFVQEDASEDQALIAALTRKADSSPTDKYKVNLMVDNGGLQGAPVIVDLNPTYYNLLGKLEYENEFGAMTTDYTMIKPGLFHQANGGYLILQAKDVLSNVQAWEALKRVLKTSSIIIENMKEQMGLMSVSTLKPEPIPASIKFILVGSEYIYEFLYEYDEDFCKYFKIKADFEEEMLRTRENISCLAQFIRAFSEREHTLPFHKSGVARIVGYSSRLVEDQNKMTTRFNDIVEILSEASVWARMDGAELVMESHVMQAITQKIFRSNKYDRRILEMMEDGTILVDTHGSVIGQINGLTIIDMGDYSFGKPSRITATTYMGERGIVNIEREVEMSGTSHSKGVLILSGYIGQKFAQDIPLALTANLCFEQLYSGVDGDSASSAELYAILSSLAEVPIRQGIAVTGSVNQRGEIQPIGGVTQKIEGFFELCRQRGFTGDQGVMIPHQNIRNLMLQDEVVNAVKEGVFHIYPVKTIDEGIEILTGVEAGERGLQGIYPPGSINHRVYEKLKRFSETVAVSGHRNRKAVK